MAKGIISLGEIADRLPMLVIQYRMCRHRDQYRTDKLVAKYGAGSSIEPFQVNVTKDDAPSGTIRPLRSPTDARRCARNCQKSPTQSA